MGVYRINRTNSSVGRINSRRVSAGAESWYLAGGIDPANCIAAYQPKGAASYAASKVNLANPGTYDATEGNAPEWDAVNGWKFNGTVDYLDSGVVPSADQQMSAILKFSDLNDTDYAFGTYSNNGTSEIRFYIVPNIGTQQLVGNGGAGAFQVGVVPSMTYGVASFAGNKIYQDGVDTGVLGVDAGINAENFTAFIGARSYSGSPREFCKIFIQAIAFYNTVLTATQVGLLTTAMNAL